MIPYFSALHNKAKEIHPVTGLLWLTILVILGFLVIFCVEIDSHFRVKYSTQYENQYKDKIDQLRVDIKARNSIIYSYRV